MTVWQTGLDLDREQAVADTLKKHWRADVSFDKTPSFFPSDYHMTVWNDNYGTYIGDLEVKWFNHDTSRSGVFNYNKLMLLASMPMWKDHPDAGHRVAFRYDNGILLAPVRELASEQPYWFTRRDTGERDLVIDVPVLRLAEKHWVTV